MWTVIGHQRELAYLNRNLKDGTLVHAYLFSGPPGVGKNKLATSLACAVNCQGTDAPCGQCSQCIRILAGQHPDVQIIGVAGGNENAETRIRTEIGIDQVRDLQHWASLPPYEGSYRVFIVDGAHQLSVEAANCLLKVLEEPPDRILFVLVTAEPERLPDTVVSRCHHLRLHAVEVASIEQALTERGIDPEQSRLLAILSHGSPGLALEAAGDLDWQTGRKQKIDRLIEIVSGGYTERFDFPGKIATGAAQRRPETIDLLEQWLSLWRDLLLSSLGVDGSITNIDYSQELATLATKLTPEEIKGYIERIQKSLEYARRNVNPQLLLEVLMLEMPTAGLSEPAATYQEKK